MAHVTVDGQVYDIGRLSAFQQLDVSRLYSPVLAQLALSTMDAEGKPAPRDDQIKAMIIYARVIPQVDHNAAINACMSVVRRKQPGDSGWGPVLEPMTNRLMYDDISLHALTDLILHVLQQHRLLEFFYTPPANSTQASPQG